MPARLLSSLSYANVMATIAVVLALGGTATAAGTLITGKNVKNESISGADIKNKTLRGADVKDGSLLKKDFKAGQLPAAATAATGATGATGARGPAGGTGPRGPSDVWRTSDVDYVPDSKGLALSLPAGNYVVHAKMGVYSGDPLAETENPSCAVGVAAGEGNEDGFFAVPPRTEVTMSLVAVLRFTGPRNLTFTCGEPGAALSFGRATLVATEVTTVHSP